MRNEQGNGCLILILIVLGLMLFGCIKWSNDTAEESERWCRDTERFFSENPHDSGPLGDAYAFQC